MTKGGATLQGASTAEDRDWLARERFERLSVAVRQLAAARSRDEVVEIVRTSARVLSGASGVAVVLRDGDQCHYLAEDSQVPLWSGQRFPLTECISGWSMTHGQQAVIPDVYADDRIPHEANQPLGVQSLIMTPVGEPEAFAALGAYWLETREPTPDEIAVMAALAGCMATALENIQLMESLREEVQRAEDHAREAEQRRQDRQVADEQIRFQARLLDAVEEAVIATDLDGKVLYWNRFAEELYGWPSDEAVGRNIMELNGAPESEADARGIMEALQSGESWSGEMVLSRRDKSKFTALVTDSPIRDASGRLVGVVGASRDNSERRRAQEHQQLLINELNHRVKNSLAIVQSIAAQSLRGDRPLAVARADFDARLMALSNTHMMMTEAGWRPVAVVELLKRTLEPFGYGRDQQRFRIDGPTLALGPRTAVAFALAIHELATNAVKYGALSNASGVVSVSWEIAYVDGAARVRAEWRESGGPPVTPPARRGFGSRLIERGLASEVDGAVNMRFPSEGVVCTMDAPLPDRVIEPPDTQPDLFPLPE
jgi:PAS domain S-box-containing protein